MISKVIDCKVTEYTKLTEAEEFLIQNVSNTTQMVVLSDTKPSNTVKGINLRANEALNNVVVQGTLWGLGSGSFIVVD